MQPGRVHCQGTKAGIRQEFAQDRPGPGQGAKYYRAGTGTGGEVLPGRDRDRGRSITGPGQGQGGIKEEKY